MDALPTKCPPDARHKNIPSHKNHLAARTETQIAFTRGHGGGAPPFSSGTPKTHVQFTNNLTEFACPCYSFSSKYLAWTSRTLVKTCPGTQVPFYNLTVNHSRNFLELFFAQTISLLSLVLAKH